VAAAAAPSPADGRGAAIAVEVPAGGASSVLLGLASGGRARSWWHVGTAWGP
jgi:hypothetical protein